MEKLRFSKSNAKLDALQTLTGKKVYVFSILSGKSCPYADKCKAWVDIVDNKRKLINGPNQEFRCYSASEEVRLKNVYESRKRNFDLLTACKTKDELIQLIDHSLPKSERPCIFRIHSAGDHYKLDYFDAWLEICRKYPQHTFYCYTKSIPFIVKRLNELPPNFLYTCSRGGRADHLIDQYNLRSATVVNSKLQAKLMGLPVDHDDRHAALPKYKNVSFALVVHGVQSALTSSSRAWTRLQKNGQGGYSRTKSPLV